MYPTLGNISGITGILTYTNTVTDSWFSILFIMVLYVIIFITLKSRFYRTSDSLTLASLMCFVLGGLLWAAQLVTSKVMIFLIVSLILSTIYSLMED